MHQWFSVRTGKTQPEGAQFQLETRPCQVSHWNSWDILVPIGHKGLLFFSQTIQFYYLAKYPVTPVMRFCTVHHVTPKEMSDVNKEDQYLIFLL